MGGDLETKLDPPAQLQCLCSGAEEPGNETSYIHGIGTKVFTKQRDYSLFVSIFGWTLLYVFTFRLHNARDEKSQAFSLRVCACRSLCNL